VTQYTTRRELREAERRGVVVTEAPVAVVEVTPPPPAVDLKNLTRRQLKEMGLFDNPEKLTQYQPAVVSSAPAVATQSEVKPEIQAPSRPVALQVPDIDFPKTDFSEQNYLSEPTTASIVLERAPEAIVLPIDTGEINITNSISVVTDPITSPNTGNFDGSELDQIIVSDDAVTGIISVVEPISALDLIDQRAASGVVPASVLSRGWWRPWAIGIAAILMTVAAVVSIIFMLNAVGSN
jgi:hypothetical protein